ncbi:MAG: Na/Pi symporter [Moraxellaceae bacterium]|nr:Na/Pi symporter [Moraxellaceae bacterium]
MDSLFTFAGGLGLFLLGMTLMTDGLKLSAGPLLGGLLNRATSTRLKGLATGFAITTLVQSSSAVTVAIIGFINAGILTFRQALWVIFGTNVGTTMTGWIVALIGFKLKIEVFALPMIALGVLLFLTGNQSRRAALGHAIAGFGVLFLGLNFLQEAFASFADQVTIPSGDGLQILMLQVLIGLIMTVVMQSSSAALAITLTAAQTGLIGLHGAAAIIIGLNVGTTVTALLAAIGATSNGKRAALAHTIFNVSSGLTALIMLPFLLPAILYMQHAWLEDPQLATTLAMFHTSFNIIGVLIMWPFANRLADWLNHCFIEREDDITKPRYLDNNIATISSLAIPAVEQELNRLGALINGSICQLLTATTQQALGQAKALCLRTETSARKLSQHISEYVVSINRQTMHESDAQSMATLLQIKRCYDAMLNFMPALHSFDAAQINEPTFLAEAAQFLIAEEVTADAVQNFSAQYATCRKAALAAGANGRMDVYVMETKLNQLSAIHKAALKADEALHLRSSISYNQSVVSSEA